VLRFAIFVVLLGSVAGFGQSSSQESSSQAAAAEASDQPVSLEVPASQDVLDAEADILKSDWHSAEAKLTPWLAGHPTDARALFAAGFVADAQNRLDDAADLYRRCRKKGATIRSTVDCLIAATAVAKNVPVSTFDQDFRKFGDVRVETE